jgi:F-type H+-transporting ATPase subunit delta
MLPRKIASRYAKALFDLAQHEGKTEAWERELATIASIIEATPELTAMLVHPEVSLADKRRVLTQLFQGKISEEIFTLLLLLIRRGHAPDLSTLHEVFVEYWNAARRLMPVHVVSAADLTEAQVMQLTAALSRQTGARVQLQRSVDPELIAGLIVTIGDRVIDASARGALEAMRATMTNA